MNHNVLLFDLELYDYRMICTAVQTYEPLAHIQVYQDGRVARCEFTKCTYDSEQTTLEFSNYVLGLTAQKGGSNVLG